MLPTSKDQYQNVRLALGEPNREIRMTLMSQFNTFGFSNIVSADTLRNIKNTVIKNQVDLIICDENIEGDFAQLIKDIRHQRIGNNPFLVAVATIEELTSEKVRQLTDCGIDDIIVKPISVGKLLERLRKIATSRKPFVVTTDYTGPDRRKSDAPREGAQVIPTIDAPNPLVYLTEKGADKFDATEAIAKASAIVNEQKMERHAFQMSFLVKRILPLYNERNGDEVEIKDIDRLIAIAIDISKRLKISRFSDAANLCKSLTDLVKRIRLSHPDPTSRDLELLPQLSQAVELAFQETSKGSSSVQAIVDDLKISS